MSVDITQDELDVFSKNGISEDDIRNTVNSYRNEGVSDEEIRAKFDTKLKSFNSSNKKPTIKEKINSWNTYLEEQNQKMNEDVKTRAKENLRKRAEWEEKHPFISGFQKDYQPATVFTNGQSYRGQVPQWELEAKYGLNAPISEKLKTDAKSFGLNLVAPVNIGVDIATGGESAVARNGAKIGVKELIKNGIKQGIKTGGIGGITQGITSSLADNGISTDLIKRPLRYGGFGALLGIPLGAAGGYLSSKAEPLLKAINEFKGKFGRKVPKVTTSVEAKIIPSENEVLEGWNGTVGADISDVKPSVKYQKTQNPAYREQLEEALGLTADNWDKEPDFYSKEMEDEAFSILSQATGKSVRWLKSQLKSKSNGRGMAKRREFIEMLLEHTDDKLSEYGDNASFYDTRKLGYEAKDSTSEQVGLGQELAEQVYDDIVNNNFNLDPRDPLTKAGDTAEIEYKKIFRELIDSDHTETAYNKAVEDFQKVIKDLPEEYQVEFENRFYDDLDKAWNVKLSDDMRAKGDLKKSSLAQNADLPDDMSQSIKKYPPEYEVLHNNDLITSAQEEITKDPSSRLARLDDMTSKNNPLSAQDFEEARQLVGKLYQEGRIDEALALTQKISIAGSRAGQSVQAMSLWAKTTPEGAVRQAQKIIDDYNKNARKKIPDLTEEQAKKIMDMAQSIQEFGENAGREKDIATGKLLKYFADLVPQSSGNKLKTVRNISLLLNPKTFMRNITGNAIFSGMENGITKPIAAGLDKLAGIFTGNRTRVMPQFKEYGKGIIKGFKEGAEDVDLGIDTRGVGGRFDLPQSRSFENTPVVGALEKALDYSLRVPDRAFYEATFQESLANQLKAAGTNNITDEMVDVATKEALESVYQNGGKLSDTVLKIRRGLNNIGIKDFGLGDALVPYAQTPANVAQQGINYSPLGLIKSGINFAKGNQRQATLDAARSITGTGIIGTGYGLSKSGNITPEIEDYQTRKNYEAIGERPNQIRLPDGSYMSYTQLQPLAAPLSAGAILGDLQDGDYMAALDKSVGSIADLSMLRGLNDFANTYNEKGVASALLNTVTNIPSQYIGTGINQINAYIDPYQRETYNPNPLVQSLNQARAKTPLLSKTLPKKYDITGKEAKKYDSTGIKKFFDVFVNPVFVNKPKDDLVMQEVIALTESMEDKEGLLYLPEKKIELDNGVTKQLSGKEYSEYSKVLGEVTYQGYQKVMNTSRYQNADDETRLKLLSDIKKNAKAITQEELFGKKNKYSSESAMQRKIENRLNRGQNKINRILNKMDNQLVDEIMYKEE